MSDAYRPWEKLLDLLNTGDQDQLRSYLDSLKSEEVIRSMSHISMADQSLLLSVLSPQDSAEIIEEIPSSQAISIIENLEVSDAAAIVNEMESDEQADLMIN